MKNASKLLALTLFAALIVGPVPHVQAGPMGPSARAAARLKKRPTSAWLAHYLPDDRYKIAGNIWKFVSTDLDTYYHLPSSPLMLRQPAGRVIGFSSAAEAEEAGYSPEPGLDPSIALNMSAMASGVQVAPGQRVTLADGTSSLVLPGGWKKSAPRSQNSQYVNATSEQFFGPKGERFEVSTIVMNLPATAGPQAANMDMAQFVNVGFFNRLKANMRGMVGNIDRLSQSSGRINSQFSSQNMVKAIDQLDSYRVFRVNLGGMEGVGMSATKKMVGQPGRNYSVGKGRKVWSISDYSPRSNSLAGVLKTVQLR